MTDASVVMTPTSVDATDASVVETDASVVMTPTSVDATDASVVETGTSVARTGGAVAKTDARVVWPRALVRVLVLVLVGDGLPGWSGHRIWGHVVLDCVVAA